MAFQSKPIPGLDRPAHADDLWRCSLREMIRLADISLKHEDRKRQPEPISLKRHGRYSAAQLKSLETIRKHLAE